MKGSNVFEITIYEDGEACSYYLDGNRNALDFEVDEEKLGTFIAIVLKSGHSLEIKSCSNSEE